MKENGHILQHVYKDHFAVDFGMIMKQLVKVATHSLEVELTLYKLLDKSLACSPHGANVVAINYSNLSIAMVSAKISNAYHDVLYSVVIL